jgi:hypothetical protein
MRRLSATLGTAILLLSAGCGLNSYEKRLDMTLENMRYIDRLNRNLEPAETKPKWEPLLVFLRPPKGLKPAKVFLLTAPEPGKFDIEASFLDPGQTKQSLHVLVRVKTPKKAAKKKVASPADTADRTNFNRDILTLLSSSYPVNDDLTIAKFKSNTEKKNEYKNYKFPVNDKNVEVYLFKKDPYEAALIFEFPKSELPNLVSKIKLCLESFAVGDKAKQSFSGPATEEGPEGAAGGGGPGVSF